MTAELDEFKVVNLTTGDEFTYWESISLTEAFLTPCASLHLEAGSEFSGPDLAKKLPMGCVIQASVNDRIQFTGYVDAVDLEVGEHSGSKVTIDARDFLSPLVDGNVDPSMKVSPSTTIADLVELVIRTQFNFQSYTIFEDPQTGDAAIGSNIKRSTKYTSRHKRKSPIKEVKPHDQEGAYAYLARILSHYGYWIWADPAEFGVIVGGPDYKQTPAYDLKLFHDPQGTGKANANNITKAHARTDQTGVPSVVYVRGVDSSAGTKGKVKAFANNEKALAIFKPAYIVDRDAKDQQTAETKARLFLARQMRRFFTYECTVPGFSDRASGNVFNVNAIATVHDEKSGVDGPLWIESRTFNKSRSSGTSTTMRMIPPGTLLLDWEPEDTIDQPKDYADASSSPDMGAEAPSETGDFTFNGTTFYESEQG